MPNFDIVTIDKLFSHCDGLLVILSDDGLKCLEVAVVSDDVGSVIGHDATLWGVASIAGAQSRQPI
ncbi:hypothetical protein A4A58_19600 [Tardiphaga robiniae]|uniref:Uncharacterized protein n=1 Tax=Tardiphaga robiniae TaxID=943830 RepID=A0A161SKE6_9BRAD|nr:hypothetical protein A4A58_19600 [Tardiphaga robiniae]